MLVWWLEDNMIICHNLSAIARFINYLVRIGGVPKGVRGRGIWLSRFFPMMLDGRGKGGIWRVIGMPGSPIGPWVQEDIIEPLRKGRKEEATV